MTSSRRASSSARSTASRSCSSSARRRAQFENLAEGYVNCIRVLRDDNLKFYVLQYYEDFIKLALERGELHAAATLYQEAAAFAARAGLPYDRHYQHKSALTWMRCAEQVRRDRRAGADDRERAARRGLAALGGR